MAKIKSPKYYAYYDKKSGEIQCVTSEKSKEYEYGIEITHDEADKFVSGIWRFRDFIVGYKNPDDKSSIAVLSRDHVGYTFKNNLVEWIIEHDTYSECTIEWNSTDATWYFYLDKDFKKTSPNVVNTQLMFFVTLETDFDFLVRTIYVKVDDLLSNSKVAVPFESNIENKIDKISISTKNVFKSYKLKVVNDK